MLRALGGDPTLAEQIQARHREIDGTEEQELLLQGTSVDPNRHQPADEEFAISRRERLANVCRLEAEASHLAAEASRVAAEAAERRSNLVSFRLHAIEEEREILRRNGVYSESQHGQWFRDRLLAAAQTDPMRLVTDGSGSAQNGLTLWTVAHRVQALGLHFRHTQPGERDRCQALGAYIAAEYRRRNGGRDPPKIFRGDAPTVVGGSNVAPNGYSTQECETWVDGLIQGWMASDVEGSRSCHRNPCPYPGRDSHIPTSSFIEPKLAICEKESCCYSSIRSLQPRTEVVPTFYANPLLGPGRDPLD